MVRQSLLAAKDGRPHPADLVEESFHDSAQAEVVVALKQNPMKLVVGGHERIQVMAGKGIGGSLNEFLEAPQQSRQRLSACDLVNRSWLEEEANRVGIANRLQ